MIAAGIPVGIAHELADEGPGWPAPPPVIHDERPALTSQQHAALRAIPLYGAATASAVAGSTRRTDASALQTLVSLRLLGLVTCPEGSLWRLTPKGRQML